MSDGALDSLLQHYYEKGILARPTVDENGNPVAAPKPAPAPAPPPPANGGLPLLEVSKDPDKNVAKVLDARWNDLRTRFLPLEDQLFSRLFADPEAQIQAAGDAVAQTYDSARQDIGTDMRRAGLDPQGELAQSMARVSLLNRARDIATAKNTGRRTLSENRMNMLGDLMGIGRGIAGSSQESLSSAASSQAAREQIGKQTAAGKTSSALGLAGMGAGIGSYLAAGTAVAGPVGALIGGGLGLLAGLF